jgi:acetolactate synthase-1/2/3 large subunit
LDSLLRHKPSLVDEDAVLALEGELERARRIVFFIGSGASEAIDAIMELVGLTQALFITTPDAKGLINPRHNAYRGVFGFGGHASAEAVLRDNPDLVVAFGTGFGELSSSGWCDSVLNSRLIHVDNAEENLMRSPMARLHVCGRIRLVCDRIIERLRHRTRSSLPHETKTEFHGLESMLQASEQYHSDATPIKPQRLMKELSQRCPPNTRFLADTGNSMIWAAHYLQPHNRREVRAYDPAFGKTRVDRRSGTSSWFRVTMDFAPMGWAIGAAIGVARSNAHCPVVCITGDGAYLMSGQEITTAAEEQLPVIFVILNDSAYGMVMHGQRLAGAEPVAFELPKIDYRLLAESMGIPGCVIQSPQDFESVDFDEILSRKGPTILDVRIDREEIPPMILRLKTLGSVKK